MSLRSGIQLWTFFAKILGMFSKADSRDWIERENFVLISAVLKEENTVKEGSNDMILILWIAFSWLQHQVRKALKLGTLR